MRYMSLSLLLSIVSFYLCLINCFCVLLYIICYRAQHFTEEQLEAEAVCAVGGETLLLSQEQLLKARNVTLAAVRGVFKRRGDGGGEVA